MMRTGRDDFQQQVYSNYDAHGRHDLPWRLPTADGRFDPYQIMVSELMLQQTQVPRVIPKFTEFLVAFPSLEVLASAEQAEVLRAWSGLGYNRRAKFLWQAAQAIIDQFGGEFPRDTAELVRLPGIGPNTAGAIQAYAFNLPAVFIETNIRTVMIHHFFADQTGVPDKAILDLVTETLDREHPREWYWALMDYGSFLKQTVGNLNKQSTSYAKQSTFQGSRRQIRGLILKLLAAEPQTLRQLQATVNDPRLAEVLADLQTETLIKYGAGIYSL
jgi:A/G-specific adenine glycosylase